MRGREADENSVALDGRCCERSVARLPRS